MAATLAEDLKSWLDDETKELKPPPPPPLPRPRSRLPRPALAALACLVLVALLGSVGLWLANRPRDTGPVPPPAAEARAPFKGWIDILVSEPNNKRRQLLRLHEP